MKKQIRLNVLILSLIMIISALTWAQKVETIDGVKVVHNDKQGNWGKDNKVSLEFVRTIGDIESTDENVLFYMPSGIIFDLEANMYVLDSGNHRIQKFSRDGKFLATIGNKGQGPGEFYYPQSMALDKEGFLYVSDSANQRIQILEPTGAVHKTLPLVKLQPGNLRITSSGRILMASGGLFGFGPGSMQEGKSLPKLIKFLNQEGEVEEEFGEQRDFQHTLLNRMGNQFHFTVDKSDHILLAFDYQNRIEKYSPEWKLQWKSDRELEYSMDPPKAKGSQRSSGGRVSIEMPQMNKCSSGIAVDEKGRIWVVTLKRQIKENEQVGTSIMAMQGASGERTMSMSVEGNTDTRETDMFQLEIYDPEGSLLGKIPVNHFVDDIHIVGGKVYLLDRMRGMQYFEYVLTEN
jgi:hypothetical protein